MDPAAYLALIAPRWRAAGDPSTAGERHEEFDDLRELLLAGCAPSAGAAAPAAPAAAFGAGGPAHSVSRPLVAVEPDVVRDPDLIALAEAVARACMGDDHLWYDLGLPSRTELSDLLHEHFPLLAARNVNNMRWKKFFYQQLCAQVGIRACRAPSCGVCAQYGDCFGSEELPLRQLAA